MGYDEYHSFNDPLWKSFEVEQLLLAKYVHPQKKSMEVKIEERLLRNRRYWQHNMAKRLDLQGILQPGEITEEE